MELGISSETFPAKLRELVTQNLDRVTSTDHVHAGIYRKAGGDHVVIAACHSEVSLLLLFISDKILTLPAPDTQWDWQYGKHSMLSAITRLNRETVTGTHELYEFSDGVIYAFKQCVLLASEPTEPLLCGLIEGGIREFEAGIMALGGKES